MSVTEFLGVHENFKNNLLKFIIQLISHKNAVFKSLKLIAPHKLIVQSKSEQRLGNPSEVVFEEVGDHFWVLVRQVKQVSSVLQGMK